MNILLFGVSNVGKSVSGRLLAYHLNYTFYDLDDEVIAVTPLSYNKDIRYLFASPDVISIELTDSAENIFDRLVFSDENDVIYKDDDYKNRHMVHYLEEIQADLDWYGTVYSDIKNRFDLSGMAPEEAVSKMINEFHLCEDTEGVY